MFNERDYRDPKDDLDWRWQRVVALCDEGIKPKRQDDEYVWMGRKFLQDLRSTKNQSERYALAMEMPEVSRAFSIYNCPTLRKEYVEALSICEDLTLEAEAEYLGESQEVIELYEKLFFDVRERRSNKGFLCTRIISPAILKELHDAKHPVYAWKLVAVYGGSPAVKACWEFNSIDDDTISFFKAVGISQMFKNFGLAQYFRPVNRYTALEVTDHVMRLLEVEVKEAAVTGASKEVTARASLMEEVLTACKFVIPSPNDPLPDPKEHRLTDIFTQKTGVN
jgi:hypothetical protein